MATIIHTCDRCNRQTELSITTPRFVCRCGRAVQTVDTASPEYRSAAVLCSQCQHFLPKGCSLLPRPCRVRLIWGGEQEPPELCPQREKLTAL
jgi:hypothetical protein